MYKRYTIQEIEQMIVKVALDEGTGLINTEGVKAENLIAYMKSLSQPSTHKETDKE